VAEAAKSQIQGAILKGDRQSTTLRTGGGMLPIASRKKVLEVRFIASNKKVLEMGFKF
jgi:hypothetical protein